MNDFKYWFRSDYRDFVFFKTRLLIAAHQRTFMMPAPAPLPQNYMPQPPQPMPPLPGVSETIENIRIFSDKFREIILAESADGHETRDDG